VPIFDGTSAKEKRARIHDPDPPVLRWRLSEETRTLVPSVKSGLGCVKPSTSRRLVHLCRTRKPRNIARSASVVDVIDIAQLYQAGETTQRIVTSFGISKTRVATVLREEGITIRRHGLNDGQVNEAATFYVAGKSLAWLGARYGVSHTTIANALRRQGIELRSRPGWS
jgi:hypothetical protein